MRSGIAAMLGAAREAEQCKNGPQPPGCRRLTGARRGCLTHRMSRSPLHRGVMRVLIGEIVAGTYEEGELLPKVGDLAVQFDVSQGVVRECLLALQERGFVEVRHGH